MTTLPPNSETVTTFVAAFALAAICLMLFGLVVIYCTVHWTTKLLVLAQGAYDADIDADPLVLGRHGASAMAIANKYGLPYDTRAAIRLALAEERIATLKEGNDL